MTSTATRRTRPSDARPAAGRVFVAFAAVLVGMVVAFMTALAAPVSAASLARGQNGVGVIAQSGGQRVGPHEPILAGQGRQRAPAYDQIVVGSGVGAETASDGAGSVVRHYTTQEAADAISKGGYIEPGPASGKIWITPDEYATGAEAQSQLALRNTPDGYFEFPFENVVDPSPASTVEPYYGQPGGGTEITTENPIDVGGIPFQLFELPGVEP